MINSGKKALNLAVISLITSVIISIALVVSIALVFTIGRDNNSDNSANENLPIGFPIKPCECGCPKISPQITAKIVNGETAVPHSWPWQLLLVVYNLTGTPISFCGATLVTTRHVLTAAHCVFGFSPRYIGLFPSLHEFNISNWSRGRSIISQRIYVHETYDDISLNDDVAVIRLSSEVTLNDRISLACLAPEGLLNEPLVEGERLVATGWGVLSSVNIAYPSALQQVRLQYVSSQHQSCAPLITESNFQRPGQMCAGFPPKAVCFGDSGGPLVRLMTHTNGETYWQQVGIMSGTFDCGYASNFSDVYARVSHYHSWIIDKIRQSP